MRRVRQKAIREQATTQLGRVPRKPVLRYMRRLHRRPDTMPSVHARQGHGETTYRPQRRTNKLVHEANRQYRADELFEKRAAEKRRWESLRKELRKNDFESRRRRELARRGVR